MFSLTSIRILLISVFICSEALPNGRENKGADVDPLMDIIADNYEAGPYLIYDCQEKHWTCVTEPYFKECEAHRKVESDPEIFYYQCAPFGAFPSKKSCFQRQLFLTTQNYGQRFCVKEKWKQKAIN